jgi:hypothetical protein
MITVMSVGHIVYKAEDLQAAVEEFRERGFEVEYGRPKNPRNALVYFSQGPYLEIRTGVTMPAFVRRYLRLIGQGRMVDASDAVASMPEGYCRVVFEVEREDFGRLKAICRGRGVRTITTPISRKDSHGRRLTCLCLSPDDWALPMFVTRFAADTHRGAPHPNGTTRIDHIVFEGTQTAVEVCRLAGADDLLTCRLGAGGIRLEFV